MKFWAGFAVVLMCAVGCGGSDDSNNASNGTSATSNGATSTSNGVTSNGTSSNGTSSNGTTSNGTSSNGTSNGTSSNGTTSSGNRAPELAKIGSKRARVGVELSFEAKATDADDDDLNYSVFGELPDGAKFDKSSRRFTWTPNQEQLGQLVILTFAVSDGDLEDRETVQMTVVDGSENAAPELSNPGDQIVGVGEMLTLQLEATDPDGDALEYSIDGPAPGSSNLNAETGVFTWTPTLDDQGVSLRVLFVVSDGKDRDDVLVRLVVSELELKLGEINAQQVRLGEPLALTLPIENPAGLEVRCSTVGAAPGGSALEGCTFSWTPTDENLVGSSVEVGFQVEATDNGEPVVLVTTVTIAILPPAAPVNDPCEADMFEPNELLEEAALVTESSFAHQNLTICEGDLDVFAIELQAGQQLDATIRFEHIEGDLDMEIYLGEALDELVNAWSVTDDETITLTEAPETGLYYIEIYSVLPDVRNSYDLEIQIQETSQCQDDDAEPNDRAEDATIVTGGYEGSHTICPDNVDLFSVLMEEGQLLRSTILFERDVDFDLEIVSPSGRTWRSAGIRDIEELIIPNTEEAGVYTITVLGFSGSTGDYFMEVAVADGVPCTPDDSEPNDSIIEPTDLSSPEGELTERTACGDPDWYAFAVPPNTEVIAGLTSTQIDQLRFRAWDDLGDFIVAGDRAEETSDITLGPFPEETFLYFSVDTGIGVTYTIEILAF